MNDEDLSKPNTIVVRATNKEIRALKALAKREGVKRSEMLRIILRKFARDSGIWNELNND